MRTLRPLRPLFLPLLLAALIGCQSITPVQVKTVVVTPPGVDREVVFQVSTINALLAGVYDGDMRFDQLKQRGDFGLGTFQALDGEMLALDGEFYQVRDDGKARPVPGALQTPFAAVTFFDADQSILIEGGPVGYEIVKKSIDTLIPNKNIFYAIRLDGEFQYVRVRSVPLQKKPYRPLVAIVETESKIFEHKNVKGTLVGFWCPAYVDGVNVPGYHLHFITEDRAAGGHLLECQLLAGKVTIDSTPGFQMLLPNTADFARTDLSPRKTDELHKVEVQPAK